MASGERSSNSGQKTKMNKGINRAERKIKWERVQERIRMTRPQIKVGQ